MTNYRHALVATVAALSLAACDSEDVENTPIDDIDEIVDEDEPYPVGGELSEDQQANYDAMDRQAVSDEYDANRSAMMDGSGSATSSGGTTGTSSTMSTTGSASGSGGASPGSASGSTGAGGGSGGSGGTSGSGASSADDGSAMAGSGSSASGTSGGSAMSMPARSAMTFDYLDRNGDGELSVAEYAIWALPTNPNPPEPNDALGPHLTTDQINTAGQTFFYFDEDGDSYLSPEEFQAARNSGRTP